MNYTKFDKNGFPILESPKEANKLSKCNHKFYDYTGPISIPPPKTKVNERAVAIRCAYCGVMDWEIQDDSGPEEEIY